MATNKSVEKLRPLSSFVNKTESIYKSVCHIHPHDELREKDIKKLIVVSVICLIFMIAEIVGGILSNSLAIASDAAHLLTDFSAFMVSLSAICISSQPQTRKMSFGFHRAEVLGALISVLMIWLVTGILVYMAVQRLIYTDYEIDAVVMMFVSVGGISANVVMAITLIYYNAGSSEEEEKSINMRSAAIHVLGDLFQSVGVLVAALVIYFKPEWKSADPICTFLFSVIVLCTTLHILKDIVFVLMEGFPKHLNFTEVKSTLYSVPGVVKVHNLRAWSLTLEKMALSAHVVVDKGVNTAEVLRNASQVIHNDLNIYEVTLQVEEQGDPVCAVCAQSN